MRLAAFARAAAVLAVLIFLVGCSSMPAPQTDAHSREVLYESRLASLSLVKKWEIGGRLAVNDGKDGGSGNFNWRNEGESNSMSFHGALGRGAWRLEADRHNAVLELADGETFQASTINQLVEQRLGWKVPVDALSWWVRGLAAPGNEGIRQLDADGQLEGLEQFGWVIQYGRYKNEDGVVLPVKVTARKNTQTVKLVVRDWKITPCDGWDAPR